jgi:hypothetical protein
MNPYAGRNAPLLKNVRDGRAPVSTRGFPVVGNGLGGLPKSYWNNIARLFSRGEAGFFYDPSIAGTVFQDWNGRLTLPTNQIDNPVGTVLDHKTAILVSDNMITNPYFTDDIDTWGPSTVTLSHVAGGLMRVNNATAGFSNFSGSYNEMLPNLPEYFDIRIKFHAVRSWPSTGFRFYYGLGTTALQAVQNTLEEQAFFRMLYRGSGTTSILIRTNASLDLDVDYITARKVSGYPASAGSDAARPLLQTDGNRWWFFFDLSDDLLTTETPALGSAATVITANEDGVSVLENQTIGAGPYNLPANKQRLYAHLVINRALTYGEITDVTRLFRKKAGL